MAEVLHLQPLDSLCRSFCSQHASTSLRHATAAAQALVALERSNAAEAGKLITSFRSGKGEWPAWCIAGQVTHSRRPELGQSSLVTAASKSGLAAKVAACCGKAFLPDAFYVCRAIATC